MERWDGEMGWKGGMERCYEEKRNRRKGRKVAEKMNEGWKWKECWEEEKWDGGRWSEEGRGVRRKRQIVEGEKALVMPVLRQSLTCCRSLYDFLYLAIVSLSNFNFSVSS